MYAHPTMPTGFLLAYTLVTCDGLVWVEKFLNPTMSLKKHSNPTRRPLNLIMEINLEFVRWKKTLIIILLIIGFIIFFFVFYILVKY